MRANSSFITSAQTGVHEQLPELVSRHLAHPFQKPILEHNRAAFMQSMDAWQAHGAKPLILDAGCGVGLSTLHLATQFPDHFVIGVDQSSDRLERNTHWHSSTPDNVHWARADLVDYWRLMITHKIYPQRHYILYPNPWPKIGHLARRWHGHAVFPAIVALGGQLECRSNWRIYIDEFAAALSQITNMPADTERFVPTQVMTPFEEKYLASGHTLWRCRVALPGPGA